MKSHSSAKSAIANSPNLRPSRHTCALIMASGPTDAEFVPRPSQTALLSPSTCALILERNLTSAIFVISDFPSQEISIVINAYTWSCESTVLLGSEQIIFDKITLKHSKKFKYSVVNSVLIQGLKMLFHLVLADIIFPLTLCGETCKVVIHMVFPINQVYILLLRNVLKMKKY